MCAAQTNTAEMLHEQIVQTIVEDIRQHALYDRMEYPFRNLTSHPFQGFTLELGALGNERYLQKLVWQPTGSQIPTTRDFDQIAVLVNAALVASEPLRQQMRGLRLYPQIQSVEAYSPLQMRWWFKQDLAAAFPEELRTLDADLMRTAATILQVVRKDDWTQITIPNSYPAKNFVYSIWAGLESLSSGRQPYVLPEIRFQIDPSVPSVLQVRLQK